MESDSVPSKYRDSNHDVEISFTQSSSSGRSSAIMIEHGGQEKEFHNITEGNGWVKETISATTEDRGCIPISLSKFGNVQCGKMNVLSSDTYNTATRRNKSNPPDRLNYQADDILIDDDDMPVPTPRKHKSIISKKVCKGCNHFVSHCHCTPPCPETLEKMMRKKMARSGTRPPFSSVETKKHPRRKERRDSESGENVAPNGQQRAKLTPSSASKNTVRKHRRLESKGNEEMLSSPKIHMSLKAKSSVSSSAPPEMKRSSSNISRRSSRSSDSARRTTPEMKRSSSNISRRSSRSRDSARRTTPEMKRSSSNISRRSSRSSDSARRTILSGEEAEEIDIPKLEPREKSFLKLAMSPSSGSTSYSTEKEEQTPPSRLISKEQSFVKLAFSPSSGSASNGIDGVADSDDYAQKTLPANPTSSNLKSFSKDPSESGTTRSVGKRSFSTDPTSSNLKSLSQDTSRSSVGKRSVIMSSTSYAQQTLPSNPTMSTVAAGNVDNAAVIIGRSASSKSSTSSSYVQLEIPQSGSCAESVSEGGVKIFDNDFVMVSPTQRKETSTSHSLSSRSRLTHGTNGFSSTRAVWTDKYSGDSLPTRSSQSSSSRSSSSGILVVDDDSIHSKSMRSMDDEADLEKRHDGMLVDVHGSKEHREKKRFRRNCWIAFVSSLILALLTVLGVYWYYNGFQLNFKKHDHVAIGKYQSILSQVSSSEKLKDESSVEYESLYWMYKHDPLYAPNNNGIGRSDDLFLRATQGSTEETEILLTRYLMVLFVKSAMSKEKQELYLNWFGAQDTCFWFGVTCNSSRAAVGKISSLNFENEELVGSLPEDLFSFPPVQESLVTLNLSHNQLKGSIPSSLFSGHEFQKLKEIILDNNMFTGSLEFVEGKHRELLDSDSRDSTNNVLEVIQLSHNRLTGEIPPQLLFSSVESYSSLTNLKELKLSGNKFSGDPFSIMPSLTKSDEPQGNNTQATSLESSIEVLHVDDNNLSGKVSSQVLQLWSSNLQSLKINGNTLSGYFPDSVDFEKLEELEIQKNDFIGAIYEDGLCSSLPSIVTFSSDCGVDYVLTSTNSDPFDENSYEAHQELVCSCCTKCFYDNDWKRTQEIQELVIGLYISFEPNDPITSSNNEEEGGEEEGSPNYLRVHDPSVSLHGRSFDLTPFSDPKSVQSKALEWILEKDPLRIHSKLFSRLYQRFTLAVFGFSFKLNSISNGKTRTVAWFSKEHECDWYGVVCEGSSVNKRNIVGINMNDNGLEGTLPTFELFYLLSNTSWGGLKGLNLPRNQISGSLSKSPTLPSSSLAYLDLHENFLTGSLPYDFFSLHPKLEYLYLSKNRLSGSLPSQPQSHSSVMKEMWLYSNNFLGTIPESVQLMTSLVDIDLHSNKLSGPIPFSILDSKIMTNLTHIDLSHNLLTSVSKSKIISRDSNSSATIAGLRSIQLNSNKIKTSISNIISLFGDENETGTEPHALEELLLDDNLLTGPIPKDMSLFKNLKHLHLQSNNLKGGIPSTLLRDLEQLISINLSQNSNLRGDIFSLLSSIKQSSPLEELHIYQTQLTGSIPNESEMMTLDNLKTLNLNSNFLSGSIPRGLLSSGIFPKLMWLDLSSNFFDGNIHFLFPLENDTLVTGNNIQLEMVNLTGNFLDGPMVPMTTSSYTSHYLESVRFLLLSDNILTGAIPQDLFTNDVLPNLEQLELHKNDLTDTEIPSGICLSSNTVSDENEGMEEHHELIVDVFLKRRIQSDCKPYVPFGSTSGEGEIAVECSCCVVCYSPEETRAERISETIARITNPLQSTSKEQQQKRALTWIVDEDPLHVHPKRNPTFVQRYILALFGFSTNLFMEEDSLSRKLKDEKPSDRLDEIEQADLPDAGDLKGNTKNVTNWFNVTHECNWFGILCESTQDELYRFVTGIDLGSNHLDGVLPDELSYLSQLRVLNVPHNYIRGNIPLSFTTMKNLGYIDLSDNLLTGVIPSSTLVLGSTLKMPNLFFVYLNKNQLHGEIPLSVDGDLTSEKTTVKELWLHENNLTGSIPFDLLLPRSNSISNNSSFTDLDLNSNQFHGNLDKLSSIASDSLSFLDLSNNHFSGNVPGQFFSTLSFPKLKFLYLDNNELTGDLFQEENLVDGTTSLLLEELFLNDNNLTGSLSVPHLFSMPNLRYLMLQRNKLTGGLLSSTSSDSNGGRLSNLSFLDISNNNFSGDIFSPNFINELIPVTSTNDGVSENFTNSSNLEFLYADYNSFSDLGLSSTFFSSMNNEAENSGVSSVKTLQSISKVQKSDIIRGLLKVKQISAGSNQLSGSISSHFALLFPYLELLSLDSNKFNSTIPENFGSLSDLKWLDLSSNEYIHGDIPNALFRGGNITSLSYLYLQANKLTGRLEGNQLSKFAESLTQLWVNDNLLTGSIPDETFASMTNLNELYLHNNLFDSQESLTLTCEAVTQPFLSSDCSQDVICPCCEECF